jgi:mono/diheme cytochrome c family protein
MKTLLAKLAFVAAALVAGCALWQWPRAAAVAPQKESAPGAADPAKKSATRELFEQRCARCHGRDGRGRTRVGEMLDAPDFTDAGWWRRAPADARLRAAIADGKGEMPAFGKKLSRSEIAALAAFVREFAPSGGRARRAVEGPRTRRPSDSDPD